MGLLYEPSKFTLGKHDASALGNGISAKRGKINIAVIFYTGVKIAFYKLLIKLTFLVTQHIRMINDELLRENGNLKDLVVQTSAGLEREKSNQDKLVHHNKLINSDNAALQSRVEELLSVIDRQRRELAGAYESSQRMAFEQSVAWREVSKQSRGAPIIICSSHECFICRLSTTSATDAREVAIYNASHASLKSSSDFKGKNAAHLGELFLGWMFRAETF